MVINMDKIELKIDETSQQHVGKGRAVIDPKILEDSDWTTGQILELTFNKKISRQTLAWYHRRLWYRNY